MSLSRREAREAVFGLLFETEFKKEEDPKEIFAISCEDREIGQDDYIKNAYFGVCENLGTIDALINRHSNGWKTTRISRVSRSILRLSVYEMLFLPDIPHSVSMNEAVELCKKYDEESARPFVNGVLNAVKEELESKEKGTEEPRTAFEDPEKTKTPAGTDDGN